MDISLAPTVLFKIGSFPITNSLWVSFFISFILISVTWYIARNLKTVPGPLQLMGEEFIMFCYNFVEDTTRNEKVNRWFFPVFTTLALFFLTANLMPFFPGLGAITFNGDSFYRTATSDYGLIFAITLVMVLMVQVVSIQTSGLLGYVKKFINFSSPLNFLLGLLDIISEFAKIVSLSFRLFGNIFAGEVLAVILLGLLPVALSPLGMVPVSLLGLLAAVIQAFVFTILVSVYLSMALEIAE